MTAEEAIISLRFLANHEEMPKHPREVFEMAIKALEEVEQYRALGAVEELKEAREKQIPKKLYLTLRGTTGYNTEEHCPVCKTRVYDSYCSGCGQVIDWSEGE